MSCWWSMQLNCFRMSILDVLLCLEMTRGRIFSRIYRLYHKITKGLDPVAAVFTQVLPWSKWLKMLQVTGLQVDLMLRSRQIIELHDKYMGYVNDCFLNHSLFYQALIKAFEVLCNKVVSGTSFAELLASFCDNTLHKGGCEKLSDDAIDKTLEKVVKLVAYISDKIFLKNSTGKSLAVGYSLIRVSLRTMKEVF